MTSVHGKFDLFKQLEGEQLSSVEFVQDYLQLRFDGPGINVYNPIVVKSMNAQAKSWDAQFRNLLCAQIAKIVAAVQVQEGSALIIKFEDGSTVTISLRSEDYKGPEALYCHGFNNNEWAVF